MKNTDLHTHTYYSDGECSPKELIKLAKKRKIKNLSLTDHNSINGINELIKEGKKLGINIIPGLELVVRDAEVLGYFIDYKNKQLKKELKKNSFYQNEKVKERIKVLQGMGINISYQKLIKKFPYAKDNYNKAHIIYYLKTIPGFNKEKVLEILEKLNKIKIKKFKKKNLSIIQGIKLIKKYKGVPVLAHPWLMKDKFNEFELKKWIKIGLKGIEIENGEEYNFGRTKEFVKKIKKLAKKYNLILTSGSDFHGIVLEKFVGTHKLGKYNCDEKIIKQLRKIKCIK